MRITRNLFAAVLVTAFSQNVFAEEPAPTNEPPKPADCAAATDDAAKADCLKQAAEAVKAAQAKAADASKPPAADEPPKPADKPKAAKKAPPAQPKCPSAEEWQKLLAGKDKEIGKLKAGVDEVIKVRDGFESRSKKVEAELAGFKEATAMAEAVADAALAERDAKVKDAKDAENACAASFEARIRAAESSARDAEARAQATKPAPPTGGQPPKPVAEPTQVAEDIRPCVERIVASRFHKGGQEAAIKRCTERVLALRSGK